MLYLKLIYFMSKCNSKKTKKKKRKMEMRSCYLIFISSITSWLNIFSYWLLPVHICGLFFYCLYFYYGFEELFIF